eukprot:14909654-Alexandrium_andersonii.AAC.1
MLRSFLDPRSSSSECLKLCCMFELGHCAVDHGEWCSRLFVRHFIEIGLARGSPRCYIGHRIADPPPGGC